MQDTAENDLHATRERILKRHTSAAKEMESCIAVAQSARSQNVYLETTFDAARAAAQDPRNQSRPLAGLAVSIKDLFDVQGQVTRAGSTVLAGRPPASADCVAVQRLRAAGAAFVGRTNMVEFAYSAIGNNPHYGTPANAASGAVALIPGGSSSGAAVSVASGSAFVGLGSDTGGSIRIPAALNGIVGFKNTARLVPTSGAVPLSTTLDTAGALTRSVRDAITVHEILGASTLTRSFAPASAYRLAVVTEVFQDDLDPTVTRAFQRSLAQLRRLGAHIEEISLPELAELDALNANGGFSAAESLAWHRPLLAQHRSEYDPRVVARIERGQLLSAADYVSLLRHRADWIARMAHRLAGVDAVLSPTVPMVAPPLASVAPGSVNDEAFFKANARLLRNTSIVNLLDGCAISIPCHQAGELPVGLMLWHGALQDDTVLNIALQIEALLHAPRK